jgi:hypothetical protein
MGMHVYVKLVSNASTAETRIAEQAAQTEAVMVTTMMYMPVYNTPWHTHLISNH